MQLFIFVKIFISFTFKNYNENVAFDVPLGFIKK